MEIDKLKFGVFRKKDEPFIFRVIDNPTNEWKDLKIYEFIYKNFQVEINCIAEEKDFLVDGKGREIYSTTTIHLDKWVKISNEEVFRKCLLCKEIECPIECTNIGMILNV